MTQLPDSNYLALQCMHANLNVLRLMNGWNLCTNLRWMMCAVRGALPGQEGSRRLVFSKAPNTLERVEDIGGGSRSRYGVADVFYLEVCLLNHVCNNRDELFATGRGDGFECAPRRAPSPNPSLQAPPPALTETPAARSGAT